jgi:threonine/homoserine/homoserine lactone efflux protein
MTVEVYLAYLATVGVFFATPPGPSQILMISNSLRFGTKRSLATVVGDLTANAFQMTLAAFGLAAIIAASQEALSMIKWAGVAYLVYIAWRTFRAQPTSFERGGPAPTGAGRTLYWQGFITSAANPKAVFFFAALFPQFVDPASPTLPQLVILGVTYLVVDGVLLVIWGRVAERALGALRRRGRLLNRASGTTMLIAALVLAFRDVDVRRA